VTPQPPSTPFFLRLAPSSYRLFHFLFLPSLISSSTTLFKTLISLNKFVRKQRTSEALTRGWQQDHHHPKLHSQE
jgi:hypothetical protein